MICVLGVRVKQNGPRVVNISVFQFIYYIYSIMVYVQQQKHNIIINL